MPFDYEAAVRRPYKTLPVADTNPLIASQPGTQHIFWIGCSDSSVLETDCLGVLREEIFVHRNLGGLVSNKDASSASAVEWCLELLKVDHIVVCGHYDCGLIKEGAFAKTLNGWYKDVTKLHNLSDEYLTHTNQELSETGRNRRFEEVYVLAEVVWLKKQPEIQAAMKERGMQIHGLVYDREKDTCVQIVQTGDTNGNSEASGINIVN